MALDANLPSAKYHGRGGSNLTARDNEATKGATEMIEYALIAVLVAIVIINQIGDTWLE